MFEQYDPGGGMYALDTTLVQRKSKRDIVPTNRYGSYVQTDENKVYVKPKRLIRLPAKKYFARGALHSKVVIAESSLPNANKGLFARKTIKEGEHFAYYNGQHTNLDGLNDHELLRNNYAIYCDLKRDTLVWGSPESEGYYINDPLDDDKCNCKITFHNGHYSVVANNS